jgi:hypothetical protein
MPEFRYVSRPPLEDCLVRNLYPSLVAGGVWTGLDAVQGAPLRLLPRLALSHCGFVYAFLVLICPMEQIHGRRSAFHNVLSGAAVGYLGVRGGFIGVPLLDPTFFWRYPYIRPPLAGAAIYGAMGGLFATLSGKPWDW